MQEIVAPTPERLRHARAYVAPETTQTVKRGYTRVLDEFERLREIGKLDAEQFEASRKLQRHWLGSMGVDVRTGDGPAGDGEYEFPVVRHGSEMARVVSTLTPRMWAGLKHLLLEDGIEHVGEVVCGVRNAAQARAAGLELVQNGLDMLVRLWGIGQQHGPPRR